MTERELDQLERDARKPDYGAKHYKSATVLMLVGEVRKRQAVIDELEAARKVADAAVATHIANRASFRVYKLDGSYSEAQEILDLAEHFALSAFEEAVREYRKLREGE